MSDVQTGNSMHRQDVTRAYKTSTAMVRHAQVRCGGGKIGHTQSKQNDMYQRLAKSWLEARTDTHS